MNSSSYINKRVVKGIRRSIVIDFTNQTYSFLKEKISFKEYEAILQRDSFTSPHEAEMTDYMSDMYNCILDIKESFYYNENRIFNILREMPIISVQLRCNGTYDISHFLCQLQKLHSILNIELVTCSYSSAIAMMLSKFPFRTITLYEGNIGIQNNHIPRLNYNPLEENRQTLSFYFNYQYFIEAHHSNPYFYHKIYIDTDGNIYNAPETRQCITDIYEPIEIVKRKIYDYALTNIIPAKDKIKTCRCCEFRYSCMDNRVPQKYNNMLQYVESCYYNPYTMRWFGEKQG